MKIYINELGHMTNMPAMPIYVTRSAILVLVAVQRHRQKT